MTNAEPARKTTPIYTLTEAGRMLNVPTTTLARWTRSEVETRPGAMLVTRVGGDLGARIPSIPFIGFAEAFVLAAFRRAGVPLQRIRPALMVLTDRIGLDHALASRRLYTDGAEILYEVERDTSDPTLRDAVGQLVILRNRQLVYRPLVEQYLQCITWDADGYPGVIALPVYGRAGVVVDPTRAFGQPIFGARAVRVQDVLERFWAGDDVRSIADDYGLAPEVVEEAVRVASRRIS